MFNAHLVTTSGDVMRALITPVYTLSATVFIISDFLTREMFFRK